jgi:hypothetical protein
VLHDCTQATASGAVVLGDKEHPEVYAIHNEGEGSCVVDLVEVGMGAGGHDLCVEHKAWSDLYKFDRAAGSPDCTLDGATHAFGNTEAHAIRCLQPGRRRAPRGAALVHAHGHGPR